MTPQDRFIGELFKLGGFLLAQWLDKKFGGPRPLPPPPPPPPRAPTKEEWARIFEKFKVPPVQKTVASAQKTTDPKAAAKQRLADLVKLAKGNSNPHEADNAWRAAEQHAKKHGLSCERRPPMPAPKAAPPPAPAPTPAPASPSAPPPAAARAERSVAESAATPKAAPALPHICRLPHDCASASQFVGASRHALLARGLLDAPYQSPLTLQTWPTESYVGTLPWMTPAEIARALSIDIERATALIQYADALYVARMVERFTELRVTERLKRTNPFLLRIRGIATVQKWAEMQVMSALIASEEEAVGHLLEMLAKTCHPNARDPRFTDDFDFEVIDGDTARGFQVKMSWDCMPMSSRKNHA